MPAVGRRHEVSGIARPLRIVEQAVQRVGMDGHHALDLRRRKHGAIGFHIQIHGRTVGLLACLHHQRIIGMFEATALEDDAPLITDQPTVVVEMGVVEQRLEQGASALEAHDLRQRQPTMRPHCLLLREGRSDQGLPAQSARAQRQRHAVEKQPQHGIAARLFRPAVGDHAAHHLVLPADRPQRLEVQRQQHVFH